MINLVIPNRLEEYLINVGLDEKCGGIFQKGCIDGTINGKQALHILKHQQKDVWSIFADLENAYNMVDQPLMWQIMRIYAVPNALILVLRNKYLFIVIKFKDCGKNVRIPSNVGLKQVNNLAPIRFVFFINDVGDSISPDWERSGIKAPMI